MKPGAETKLKFKQLKRRLKMPHWQVVGILETLWRITEANAPAGDIGRLSDEEIAAAFEWDGDASELVGALADCRWLDRDEEFRLLVHDWSEHCPNHLKGAFAKNHKRFADNVARDRARHTASQHAKQHACHPATSPNLTIPNHSLPLQSAEQQPEREFLIGLIAQRNVHQARPAVTAALARGCTAEQITEASRSCDGKALLSRLETLQPPAPESKAKREVESREERRLRLIKANDAAGVGREETNRALLAEGLEGVVVPQANGNRMQERS